MGSEQDNGEYRRSLVPVILDSVVTFPLPDQSVDWDQVIWECIPQNTELLVTDRRVQDDP